MTTNPYWIRLRGTGKREGDWDEGRVFGAKEYRKGMECYVGTQQGAVILRVGADHQGQVRARVTTATHRWPPKHGPKRGIEAVVADFFVGNPDRVPLEGEQMKMFGIGSDVCRSCQAPVFWVEMAGSGKMMPIDAKPEKRIVLNRVGKAQMIESYMSHFATCPDADKWRKNAHPD